MSQALTNSGLQVWLAQGDKEVLPPSYTWESAGITGLSSQGE